MDNIQKALYYAETGKRPVLIAEDEPTEVYDMIDKLKNSNPYYFLQWWASTTEFVRAKLTRSNFLPKDNSEDERKIEITVHENGRDPGIQ